MSHQKPIHVRFATSLNVRRLTPIENAARFEVALDRLGARQILDSELQMARLEIVTKDRLTKLAYVSLGRIQQRLENSSSSDTGWLMARL